MLRIAEGPDKAPFAISVLCLKCTFTLHSVCYYRLDDTVQARCLYFQLHDLCSFFCRYVPCELLKGLEHVS